MGTINTDENLVPEYTLPDVLADAQGDAITSVATFQILLYTPVVDASERGSGGPQSSRYRAVQRQERVPLGDRPHRRAGLHWRLGVGVSDRHLGG